MSNGGCPVKGDFPIGGCQSKNFEVGIDYQGSDLVKSKETKGYWNMSETSDESCCKLCKQTEGCKYWTHGKHTPSGKWVCWVKSAPTGYEVQGSSSKYGARTSGTLVQSNDGSFKKAANSGIKKSRL